MIQEKFKELLDITKDADMDTNEARRKMFENKQKENKLLLLRYSQLLPKELRKYFNIYFKSN